MKGIRLVAMLSLVGVTALGGCVSSGKYQLKEQEAQGLASDLAGLKEQHAKLQAEQEALRGEKELLQKELATVKGEAAALTKTRDKLAADNKELDTLLKAKSDTFSKNIAEQRDKIQQLQQQNAELEKQIATLKIDITNLQKVKEEEVKKRLAAVGVVVKGSTPEELGAFMASEHKRWDAVRKAAGIPLQ